MQVHLEMPLNRSVWTVAAKGSNDTDASAAVADVADLCC